MSETRGNAVDQELRWSESLGAGAREVLSDLSGDARQHAELAFDAIAEALGEDDAAFLEDPGLPEDYTILGLLGRGGSGVVYRARQASLDREVAVKVLHPGCDARDTERLLGEARRLAALSHPGIVAVHEVGRAGAGVYMTLELQLGGSLQELLSGGGLNPTRAARITWQAAEALAYTHGRGVVHLDLKPGNVLLDAEGNARLADFGLAREIAGMEFTTTAGLLGTPAFMAPEQAGDRRELLGERTDVYGLGALLYACLAGGAPFARRSLAGTLHAVRYDEPEPLERRAPGAPRDLIAIAHTAMSKDPNQRYPTASAMAQDLARFEAGEPVEARLPGPLKRAFLCLRGYTQEIIVAVVAALMTLFTLLPFRDSDQGVGHWTQAAEELAEAGEERAALMILQRVLRAGGLSEDEERQIAELSGSLQASLAALPRQEEAGDSGNESEPVVATSKAVNKKEARFGLAGGDWDWLLAREGSEWMRDRSLFWDETLFETELVWRKLLVFLAESWPHSSPEDRDRAAAIAERAPSWAREGMAPEGDDERLAAASGRELLSRIAAASDSAALAPARFGLRVDIFVFDDDGYVERIGSEAGAGVLGDTLRFEGRGSSRVSVPGGHIGMDIFRLAPPRTGKLRTGDIKYEVEGTLQRVAGGAFWRVFDRETYLGIGRYDGSWFLDTGSDGLLAGEAGLLDVRRYLWEGGAATVVMIGEMVELEEEEALPASRDLGGWVERFAEGLERKLTWPYAADAWDEVAPARRASLFGDVIALTALGSTPAVGSLDALSATLAEASRDPAELSDGFFERGTFTGVTTAGADFGYWLDAARQGTAERPPFAVMRDLSLPGSAFHEGGKGSGWKAWLYTAYVLVGLALLVIALRGPRIGCTRLAAAAWAILVVSQGIDKTTPSELGALGSLPWDPVALAIMGAASFLLVPKAGSWARIAAWSFLCAAFQETGIADGPGSEVRLPMAIALIAMGVVAGRLDPRRRLGWLPLFAALVVVPAVGLTLIGIDAPGARSFFSVASIVCLLVVLLSVALAAARCASEEQNELADDSP